MKQYVSLFFTFAKIGVCTFGGGYAMLPILQRELVDNKGWATEEELADYYAVGQCTPGVIAVNTATFVGYNRMGWLGGTVATLGVVFPCLVIIMAIAAFLSNFMHLDVVVHAFNGVRAGVVALILSIQRVEAAEHLSGGLENPAHLCGGAPCGRCGGVGPHARRGPGPGAGGSVLPGVPGGGVRPGGAGHLR